MGIKLNRKCQSSSCVQLCKCKYSIYCKFTNKKRQNKILYSSLLEYDYFFYRIRLFKVHVFPRGDVFQRSRIRNRFLFYRTRNCILQNKKERLVFLPHFEETLVVSKRLSILAIKQSCATRLLNHAQERDFTFTSLSYHSCNLSCRHKVFYAVSLMLQLLQQCCICCMQLQQCWRDCSNVGEIAAMLERLQQCRICHMQSLQQLRHCRDRMQQMRHKKYAMLRFQSAGSQE